MVKHTLRECFSSSAATQLFCETWASKQKNKKSVKIRIVKTCCGDKNGDVDAADDAVFFSFFCFLGAFIASDEAAICNQ